MTTKAKDTKKKMKTNNKKSTAIKLHHGKKKTIEELAKEQGVKPFDFDKAGDNWPQGADFDEFMKAINSGRKYPRKW